MHQIRHIDCANGDLNKTLRRVKKWAYDPQESSGYHGNMTIHKYPVYKDYDEALKMIEKYDTGWYSDHAVRYKEGRKYRWLIKIEWHC